MTPSLLQRKPKPYDLLYWVAVHQRRQIDWQSFGTRGMVAALLMAAATDARTTLTPPRPI
jgi:hypothetical protein